MTATLDRLDRIAVTFKLIKHRVRLLKQLRLPTDLMCKESGNHGKRTEKNGSNTFSR